ncbi:MAG: class I SAM-dependent methyltransferase [Pedobacter sp.]|nr:class I SAM-dependent methyltransferase [Pedobacter sp.]
MNQDYKKALELNKENTDRYYRKSIEKTEQQKFLEKILHERFGDDFDQSLNIADIACGGGTLTHHLSSLYQKANFSLVDYFDEALHLAKDLNQGERFTILNNSIYTLENFEDHTFDIVFCWQTLSWLEDPEAALQQLLRITKPGGKLFLSSLFNLDHDVDIYSKVLDYTLESGNQGIPFSYNTYSSYTIHKWIGKEVKELTLEKFIPNIDFQYEGKGIGTFTVNSDRGRLQISAGQLLNWAVLQIIK